MSISNCKLYKDLMKQMRKEKRMGYGGIIFDVDNYPEIFNNEVKLQELLEYLKLSFINVKYKKETDLNYNAVPYGNKCIMFDWE